MEYPLPETFKETPVNIPAFLSIPDQNHILQFVWESKGAFLDLLEGANNWQVGAIQMRPTISTPPAQTTFRPGRRRIGDSPSLPTVADGALMVVIENEGDDPEDVVLFRSYISRTSSNFGLPPSIRVINPDNYRLVLAETESRRMESGILRIQSSGDRPNSDLAQSNMALTRMDGYGRTSENRFAFITHLQPWTELPLTIVDTNGISMDGFTGIRIRIPGKQLFSITYFPGAVLR